MKHDLKLILAAITALGLPVAGHAAETLTQAQITQIIKDVKTIDPGKGARSAVMKETLQGDQALKTGIESRAELLFNDKTITRLGANTHFSFSEGTRNMSLESGVMLLQVPKGIGGAKIETAAVTAAVTGTTIMIEAGKIYTKIIVLEGELCTWPKNDRKSGKKEDKFFKFKHKTCLVAGQELIVRNGSDTIPDPVYVNLKVLEGTSLLITGNWNSPLNPGPINAAADGQGPQDYVPTNLAIVGAGTDVTVIQDQLPDNPPGPPGSPPPGSPPGKYGPLLAIGGGTTIGAGTTINTDPTIKNGVVTSYGRIYRGPIFDGTPVAYLFGPLSGVDPSLLTTDSDFPNYGVAAFKFGSLTIQGTPAIEMAGNGANQLALVSLGNITLTSAAPTTLDFSQLSRLYLLTAGGNIDINSNITVTGLSGKLGLYTSGVGHTITVDGFVNLPGATFLAKTQGNYTEGGDVTADNVTVTAGGTITENGNITANSIDLESQGAFGGTGFLSAPSVTLLGGGLMTLTEINGEGRTDDVNGVQLDMNALTSLFITGNGINVPNGFTGEPQFSEGGPVVDLAFTSLNNGILSGTIHLSGNISVNSLTATADSDITADANFTSNNQVDLTSNGGDVTVTGQSTATSFSIAGNNITTGSAASLDTGKSGGTIAFTSNGSNTVTLDGFINGGTVNVTGNNVSTLSTLGGDSINGSTAINIYASNNVTLDGNINTPSLTVTGIDGGPVPVSVTMPSTGSIFADNIHIYAGIVDLECSVASFSDQSGATLFLVDTTGGSGDLTNNGGSLQDFYSLSGNGSIDAQTIQITSRGDLILNVSEGGPTVNNVLVDFNGDLSELDLTGATVEVPSGYNLSPSTLNLTANGGDITIGGNINLGTGNATSSLFTATASGNIVLNGTPTLTADTVTLTANQITTAVDPTVVAGNLTVNVNGVNVSLAQNVEISSSFFLDETSIIGSTAVGSLTLNLNGSDPSLSISANSITTGNIDASSFNSFTLSLTSANDINAGNTATISEATSIALQVGVVGTLAGDGNSNISYNNNQLTIDTSFLGTFSVTASSIAVNSGFPAIASTNLTLTASGANADTGGITVNTSMDVASANFTADTGNIVLFNSLTTESGGITLTANNGDVTAHDLLTTASGGTLSITGNNVTADGALTSGGDLTLTANNGDINIQNSISVTGNFSATASGNIFFGIADPDIGGFMNLGAGGAIELDSNLTISSDLTLSAGTYIHTFNSATVFGATSVTLTLGAPAEISEIITGGTSTLHFGVPALSEQEGASPLAIDLTNVISNDSFVNATATSLTLTSDFNEPNVSLTLEASNGSLVLNGVVTASGFTGYAYGGPLTINDGVNVSTFYAYTNSGPLTLNGPLAATSYADFYAYGGNIVINAAVTAPQFYSYSSNMTTGTGSITANTVTLLQGGSATLSQPASDQLAYNTTLALLLSSTSGGTTFIELSANPLKLNSALTLTGIDLTLSGVINTQGNTITAQNVELKNLKTAIGSGGNATNLTVNATTLTFLNASGTAVSLDGTGSGSGGTLSATTSSGTGGGLLIPASVPIGGPNAIEVNGPVTANGGSSGGNGGTITLNSAGDISVNAFVSPGIPNTGFVNGYISASGGDANTGGPAGGNAGAINLISVGNINIGGTLIANGGSANLASSAVGGNGGTVNLTSGGDTNINSAIIATSGINGNTRWTGGNGGAVNIIAQGAVVVNSVIEVSSSDLVHNRVSAKGGNINVTSHKVSGVAINITDSGQLNALLNQAAAGPGGTIKFIADKGGDMTVSGKVRADHGTIVAQTGTADGTGPGGAVTLNGANLSADVVKVGSLGSNGSLTIGNTTINGDTAIKLYAAGSNGNVNFVGPTFLTGAGLKSIAGSTVTINPGVFVNVAGGAATIYTNNPNYNGGGNGTGHVNGSSQPYGSFTGNSNTTTKPFAQRPAF